MFQCRSYSSSVLLTLSLVCCAVGDVASTNGRLVAQESSAAASKPATQPATPAPTQAVTPLPDLTIPEKADRAALEKIIATAKKTQAANLEQYRALQSALRDASNRLFKLINNREDPRSQQAELDSLAASAALMVNDTDEARENVLDRMIQYLTDRKELSLTDIKTGMLVGFYLEMQPQKTPSRDLYAAMDRMLKDDERPEMTSLRVTLQANVRRLELLGNKVQINAKTLQGKGVKTEDFAGKFLLVPFFASWSPPCVAELPRLQRHYEKYHDQGLEVLGVSMDAERGTLEKLIASQEVTWPVIHDTSNPADDVLSLKYGVLSLPTTFLVNKEGVVVSLEAFGPELDRLMQRIFEQPTPAEPEKAPAQTPPSK